MIRKPSLRKLVNEYLERPTMRLRGMGDVGLSLEESPAGRSRHHSYPSGLVEHMVATARLALALCDSVEKIYRGKIDRDLVLAGTLLHDVYKPSTFTVRDDGMYGTSPLGEKLDHTSLLIGELYGKAPLTLLHVLAAHHGRYGPVSPRTIEALIVHVADVADATLNGEVQDAARFLVKDCTGLELGLLTSEEAFGIVFAKQLEGCDGVRREVSRIEERRRRKAGTPQPEREGKR
jgi:putative nucleotidyltransferase with HDIG domain